PRASPGSTGNASPTGSSPGWSPRACSPWASPWPRPPPDRRCSACSPRGPTTSGRPCAHCSVVGPDASDHHEPRDLIVIDFRYHLVSLISVFLALAVGIALGAGPLKESIGDTLTGQVDQLREERTQLRSDLDRSQADLQRSDQALDAVAPDLLADVLGERRVALVLLDDVPDRVRDGLTTRITQAGGSVPAVVHLTETWVAPTQTAFRQSLARRLVEYLDPRPADDAGTGVELAEALVQGLTRGMPEDPDRLAEEAGIALQLLQAAGLVELDAAVEQPADAVVVVAGPTVTSVEAQAEAEDARSAEPEEAEAVEQRRAVVVDTAVVLARVAASRSAGAVLAGGDLVEGGALQ